MLNGIIVNFINSPQKVLLIQGSVSSGKTFYCRQLAIEHQAIYIALNKDRAIVENTLREQKITVDQKFLLILDGYEELDVFQNIFQYFDLSRWPNAKIIVTCRPEYFANVYDYRLCFVPFQNGRAQWRLFAEAKFEPTPESFLVRVRDKKPEELFGDWVAYHQTKYKHDSQFIAELTDYCVALAQELRRQNTTPILYRPTSVLFADPTDPWQKYFSAKFSHLRMAAPIIKTGGDKYEFISSHLVGFLATKKPVIEISQNKDKKSEIKVDTKQLAVTPKTPPHLFNHYLNQRLITRDVNMLNFLADRVWQDDQFKELLFELVFASRYDENMQVAAANAITILNSARVSFSSMDLSRIRIPNADLTGGIFDQTNLSGANLTNAFCNKMWLRQADITRASLLNVEVGGDLLLKHEVHIRLRKIAFSPLEDLLATGSAEGIVYLWDLKNYKKINTLTGHKKSTDRICYPIDVLAFSRDGLFLASGAQDSRVCVWRMNSSRQLIATLFHSTDIFKAITFTADSTKLIVATIDGVIWIWDFHKQRLLGTYEGFVKQLIISTSGVLIVSGRGQLQLWHVSNIGRLALNNKDFATKEYFSKEIISDDMTQMWRIMRATPFLSINCNADILDISLDEKTIIVVEDKKTIKYFDLLTGKQIFTAQIEHENLSDIKEMVISHNKKFMLLAGYGNTVYLYAIEERKITNTFSVNERGMIHTVIADMVFSVDDKRAAFFMLGSHIVYTRQSSESSAPTKEVGLVSVTATLDNKFIIGVSESAIMIFAVSDGRKVYEWHNYLSSKEIVGRYINICILADNNSLVLSNRTKIIFIFDLNKREVTQLQDRWDISGIALIPSMDAVMAADYVSHSFTVWSIKDKKEIMRKVDHMLEIGHNDGTGSNCVAVSCNGNVIAVGARDKEVEYWITAKWVKEKYNVDLNTELYFQPDDIQRSLPHSSPVTSCAFSQDERKLIAGCVDGSLTIWDLGDMQQPHVPPSANRYFKLFNKALPKKLTNVKRYHDHEITGIICTSTGYVITVGLDCVMRVWSLQKQCKLFEIFFSAPVLSITLCGENRFIILNGDSTLMVWCYEKCLTNSTDLHLVWMHGQSGFNADEVIVDSDLNGEIKKHVAQFRNKPSISGLVNKIGWLSSSNARQLLNDGEDELRTAIRLSLG